MCVAMVDLNDSESVRCLFRWSLHLQRLTYHKLLCSHGEGLHVQTSWHQVHASKEKPETNIQMFLKQTNLEKPMHRTYPGVHAIGLDFQRHLLTTSPSYNRTNSELYHLPLSTLYGWLCAYGCSWNCWKTIFICSLFTIHSLLMLVPYCLHSAQTYFSLLLFCADLIS